MTFSRKAVTAQERRDLAAFYGCRPGASASAACIYCGAMGEIRWLAQDRGLGWVQFVDLEIEHVHPRHQGGKGGANLDVACRPCNRAKGPRTVAEWRASPAQVLRAEIGRNG